MGRWEPNAPGRLEQAALELFAERGFEPTTVAEIAARAGLTERTFFRHYADKREVLFAGGTHFRENVVAPVREAPPEVGALEAVTAATVRAGVTLEALRGRAFAAARHRVIVANAELRERELSKLAEVSAGLADALRGRGVAEPGATMLAELGLAAFRVGFERWVADGEERSLPELIDEAVRSLTQTVRERV